MNTLSIFDLLPLPLHKIHIVDVGARYTEVERYADLLEGGIVQLVGFEQDESQLPTLNKRYPDHKFISAFIGDGSKRTFYNCYYGGCSSLYRPDPEIINQFTSIATTEGSNFEVVSEEYVQTTKLDAIHEIEACDYLKIDVQGAELDVLKGAEETLKDCLIVEVEVEFVPLYEKQPLFSDIDKFMRDQGFYLHRLMDVSGRAFRPFTLDGNPVKPVSQLLWADAIYVRKFDQFFLFEPRQLLKIAVLLHELYQSVDFCALALAHYDGQMNTSLCTIYSEVLSEKEVKISFLNIKDWTD